MMVVIDLMLIVVGFFFLIKGADFFVDGAVSVANRLKIPQIVIGLTVVAFGTSMPEAAVSIGSAIKGNAGIAIGNVLGSNILNILLILGVSACICKLSVARNTVRYEIPFMIGISIVLFLFGLFQKNLNWITGIVLWILFLAFLFYLVRQSKKQENGEQDEEKAPGEILEVWKTILYLAGGLAAVIWGSNIAVDGATGLAQFIGISDRVIGLTIVAFGTSLPELVTSIIAGRKGNADIAIGNIVGSNIFNILFILGTTALIETIPFESAFLLDGVVTIAAAVLLWLCVVRKKELNRKSGVLLLVVYAVYFVWLLVQ